MSIEINYIITTFQLINQVFNYHHNNVADIEKLLLPLLITMLTTTLKTINIIKKTISQRKVIGKKQNGVLINFSLENV